MLRANEPTRISIDSFYSHSSAETDMISLMNIIHLDGGRTADIGSVRRKVTDRGMKSGYEVTISRQI